MFDGCKRELMDLSEYSSVKSELRQRTLGEQPPAHTVEMLVGFVSKEDKLSLVLDEEEIQLFHVMDFC